MWVCGALPGGEGDRIGYEISRIRPKLGRTVQINILNDKLYIPDNKRRHNAKYTVNCQAYHFEDAYTVYECR